MATDKNDQGNEGQGKKITEYILTRFVEKPLYRYGLLSVQGRVVCFTLENGPLQKAVPAGRYELKLKKVKTPLTEKYRKKHPWFTWHIELQDVPNASGVYIHIGNTEKDTDACILLGTTCDLSPASSGGLITRSTDAFTSWYAVARKALEDNEKAYITIIDAPHEDTAETVQA